MCIAIPMKVVDISGDMGTVENKGIRREVSLSLLENPVLGDWVLIHAGFAISRLSPEEADETIALLEEAKLV